MSNLLVWAVRGLLALCLQLCYPVARFQKEESVRRDPAYAVYETYRYAYERYGYLFSYAEETGGEGMVRREILHGKARTGMRAQRTGNRRVLGQMD